MSHLVIDVEIGRRETHQVWAADIARELREVADQIEGATGAIGIKVDWPDLEAWPEPWRPDLPDMMT